MSDWIQIGETTSATYHDSWNYETWETYYRYEVYISTREPKIKVYEIEVTYYRDIKHNEEEAFEKITNEKEIKIDEETWKKALDVLKNEKKILKEVLEKVGSPPEEQGMRGVGMMLDYLKKILEEYNKRTQIIDELIDLALNEIGAPESAYY